LAFLGIQGQWDSAQFSVSNNLGARPMTAGRNENKVFIKKPLERKKDRQIKSGVIKVSPGPKLQEFRRTNTTCSCSYKHQREQDRGTRRKVTRRTKLPVFTRVACLLEKR